MTPEQRKKIAKKPVKELTEAERKLWLHGLRSVARASTEMRRVVKPAPGPAGDYPTSTMTREEFWRRDI